MTSPAAIAAPPRRRDILALPLFAPLGLGLPDVDQNLLALLHHRSILTHSVLLPALLLLSATRWVRLAGAGLLLGVAIHLSADVVSWPVGFGMVWLPWPVKLPLGWASPLWLGANAALALLLAARTLRAATDTPPGRLWLAGAVILAALYAALHEGAVAPFLVFAVLLWATERWRRGRAA